MRLPPDSAHYRTLIRYGLYVERRLRRDKRIPFADAVAAATTKILTAGRALEDTLPAIQQALADRDAIDDHLDATAQDARAALAGRARDANQNPPYSLVFPDGVQYYTLATLDEQTKRYGELKDRLEKYLPSDDPVRKAAIPALVDGIETFDDASRQLAKARSDEALAKTNLDAAVDAWERLLNKTYGALLADMPKAAAEKFFPRLTSTKAEDATG